MLFFLLLQQPVLSVQQSLTEHGEYCYSRCSNPTRYAYETLLAEI